MSKEIERVSNPLEASGSGVSPLDLNPAAYAGHLDHLEMTDAQKFDLLQSLFIIVRGFVEMGFTGNICEQIFGDTEIALPPESGAIESQGNNQNGGRV